MRHIHVSDNTGQKADFFVNDLFEMRRNATHASGNPYDPESLLSGKEASLGMTYDNSHREWPNEESYMLAVEGRMSSEEILLMHPRVFNHGACSVLH